MTKTGAYKAVHVAISEHITYCDSVVGRLYRLADALSVVGMDRVADEIVGICEHLPMSAREIQKCNSAALTENVRHSEHMAGLLLKATLQGVLGPKENAS
jgi:hypothetical protein